MKQPLQILVLVVFLATYVSSDILQRSLNQNCECGILSGATAVDVTKNVISGKEVEPTNKYPWLVALMEKAAETGDQMMKFCGGTLVSENLVLTSASCMKKSQCEPDANDAGKCKRGSSEVFVGFIYENGLNTTGQPVEKIIQQLEYKETGSLVGDLALVKLSNPIICSESMRPVCLGYRSMFKLGTTGVITGWGTTGKEEEVKDVLMNGKLKVTGRRKCWNIKDFKKAGQSVLCTSDTQSREPYCKNAGGSAFVVPKGKKFYAIGVLSKTVAEECDRSEYLPLASTSKYNRWIKRSIKKEATP